MKRLIVLLVVAGGALALAWGMLIGFRAPDRRPIWVQKMPRFYVEAAIARIRAQAVPVAPVDWEALTARARETARGASTTAETYPAIRTVLDALGEGQGLLVPPATGDPAGAYGVQVIFPERVVASVFPASTADSAGIRAGDVVELVDGRAPVASTDPRARGRFIDLPKPRVTLRVRRGAETSEITMSVGSWKPMPAVAARIADTVGIVIMPGTTSDPDFSQRVRDAIYQIDSPGICGWIVDLRRNNGGELRPVLQALRPILGEGTLGSFVGQNGVKTPWEYPVDASAGNAPPAPLARPGTPAAVLISRLTANAGEAVGVAFRGRPLTRFFGEPTWGAASSRSTITLVDGATVEVTTALIADRSGRVYDGRLTPDDPMAVDWARANTPEDPTILAAAAWVKTQAGCASTAK
jgi:C-terminal processing protease CtpA/Prc